MDGTGKIKALLNLGGKSIADLAQYYEKSPQVMRNKLHKGGFSADDLTKLAAFLGGELSIKLPNGQAVLFGEGDFPTRAGIKDCKKQGGHNC